MRSHSNFEKDYQDIISQLKELTKVRASDEFVNRFTKVLLPQLPAVSAQPFWPSFTFRLATAAVLLVLLTGTGVVFAAERSHPGEFLYPVKKVVDSIRVNLTQNPSSKIQLHLDNADQRIEELENALKKGHTNEVQNITSSYEQEVKKATNEVKNIEGNKEDVKRRVDQSLENQTQKLEDLQRTVPTTFVPDIKKALETSQNKENDVEDIPSQDEKIKSDLPSLNSR